MWQPASIELELTIDQSALNLEMKVFPTPGGSREQRSTFGPIFSALSVVLVSVSLLMDVS